MKKKTPSRREIMDTAAVRASNILTRAFEGTPVVFSLVVFDPATRTMCTTTNLPSIELMRGMLLMASSASAEGIEMTYPVRPKGERE